jgi:hypothetical protein
LNKVIERHTHQIGAELSTGFLLRSRPTTERGTLPLGDVLLAASERVDAVAEGTIDRLARRLDQITGRHTARASDWTEWIADLTDAPSVLLLLPHTVHSSTFDDAGLEIGKDDKLWLGHIRDRVSLGDSVELTILLGCETAVAGDTTYGKFPGVFRRAGGEIVVGTLTEILGRHAAPVAEALVTRFYDATRTEPVPFGELMLGARRRLLADGVVMVLAVASFGDADWLIAPA